MEREATFRAEELPFLFVLLYSIFIRILIRPLLLSV